MTNVGYVPEYHNLFQIFEWFGVSMGEKMAYLLTNSLRNLASNKGLPNVIFWGKIYGSEKDYYIESTKMCHKLIDKVKLDESYKIELKEYERK